MHVDQLPVDHIAIAVPDLAEALPVFQPISGGPGSTPETITAQGVRVAFIGTGDGRLELLEPISDDSPVARFLQRRGPGLHHIAYRVPDLEAALARLEQAGVRLIDRVPRPGAGGHRVAFLHPSAMGGVLVELVEAG